MDHGHCVHERGIRRLRLRQGTEARGDAWADPRARRSGKHRPATLACSIRSARAASRTAGKCQLRADLGDLQDPEDHEPLDPSQNSRSQKRSLTYRSLWMRSRGEMSRRLTISHEFHIRSREMRDNEREREGIKSLSRPRRSTKLPLMLSPKPSSSSKVSSWRGVAEQSSSTLFIARRCSVSQGDGQGLPADSDETRAGGCVGVPVKSSMLEASAPRCLHGP